MRDYQQSRVYSAEHQLEHILDNTLKSGNLMVDLDGIVLTLPPEARFGTLEAVQSYCNRVCSMTGMSPVQVRHRKGDAQAHYQWGVIAVPTGSKWAMREMTILHELAHHKVGNAQGHNEKFAHAFIELAGHIMGPEIGLALRVLYDHAGVKTA